MGDSRKKSDNLVVYSDDSSYQMFQASQKSSMKEIIDDKDGYKFDDSIEGKNQSKDKLGLKNPGYSDKYLHSGSKNSNKQGLQVPKNTKNNPSKINQQKNPLNRSMSNKSNKFQNDKKLGV